MPPLKKQFEDALDYLKHGDEPYYDLKRKAKDQYGWDL